MFITTEGVNLNVVFKPRKRMGVIIKVYPTKKEVNHKGVSQKGGVNHKGVSLNCGAKTKNVKGVNHKGVSQKEKGVNHKGVSQEKTTMVFKP